MSLIQAILMGVIQGITEFLPVSSSGHLAIFSYIFNVNTDTGLLFEVMLHLGTLIAVFTVYWRDIATLFVEGIGICVDFVKNIIAMIKKEERVKIIKNAHRKFVMLIIVTTIPTMIIGLLFDDLIDQASNTLLVPGICLILNAIVLLFVGSLPGGKKKVKKTTYLDALAVGTAQGVAVLPGISRSGSTICACLGLGLKRDFAVKYSFIASIPVILGANILELRHFTSAMASGVNLVYYFIGMAVSAVVGYICIRIMIYMVSNRKFSYFAYYCGLAGIVSLIFYFFIL